MEKSQVNEKYVLTLVENSDATLSVRRMDIPSSEVPIAELEAMVSSSSKRFSSIGLLYIVVFFMITSFGTAKIQNYIKLSTETSDCQFVNF